MKLRQATKKDIPYLLEIGQKAHQESRFATMPYAIEKLAANLDGLLELQEKKGSHCFLLAENNENVIVGGLIGVLEEYFFTTSISANSILLWVEPSYRGSPIAVRLIGSFHDWGKRNGADEVNILVAGGVSIARTDRFLRRLGFSQTGGNYSMPLKLS